jgi:heme-degrading monooxygenase HmoA
MPKLWVHLAVVLALAVSGPAIVQAPAQPAQNPVAGVTVVVEVQLAPNTEPEAARVAIDDMRAMMKKQPGYISETFLQNLNPGSSPRYVHVSHWASMAHWAALFRAPEFAQLSAHGNEHYTISASAFVPAE